MSETPPEKININLDSINQMPSKYRANVKLVRFYFKNIQNQK